MHSTEYFELEINENSNIVKYTDTIRKNKMKNVEDELVMKYFIQLFKIIDGWKNKYEDNNTIDGMEWQLQIIYKSGEIEEYCGKNDFHNNFEYLDKIKNEIT